MNFVVADIRIGTPGAQRLTEKRMCFQGKVVRMLFPKSDPIRLAHTHSFAFSYDKLDSNTGHIESVLAAALSLSGAAREQINTLLVDLSSSPADLVREPMLYHLANEIEARCAAGSLENVILLLPFVRMPGDDSLLMSRFRDFRSAAPEREMFILSRDGDCRHFGKRRFRGQPYGKAYRSLLNELDEDPLELLKQKMVRRIGRFTSNSHGGATRVYSYLIDNCESELEALLNDWWNQNCPECDAVVYDTGNIPSMTAAIKAFAEGRQLPYRRLQDVVENPSCLDSLRASKRCQLILDVVETGTTLLCHAGNLVRLGCAVLPDVLAVINRGGGLEMAVNRFRVKSFVNVEKDPQLPIAIQDELGVPYTAHAVESFDALRAFDIWFMAHRVGWQPEQQVPENVGYAYKMVPIFPEMMMQFGDWIAYRMDRLLRQSHMPQDFFIVHPDEPGANSVSDRLRTRLDPKTLIVRVPRLLIKQAQGCGNDWKRVLQEIDRKAEWFYRLESMEGANVSAVVTDVFNGSGSTFVSLLALLNFLTIPCYCYFPFVDRDGFEEKVSKYPVTRLTLYSWYGPRRLKDSLEVAGEP